MPASTAAGATAIAPAELCAHPAAPNASAAIPGNEAQGFPPDRKKLFGSDAYVDQRPAQFKQFDNNSILALRNKYKPNGKFSQASQILCRV